MLFFRIMMFSLLLFMTQNVFAACDRIRCTGKVAFIYINTESIRLQMDQDMSPLNCDLSGGRYATLSASHPFREEIYKTLLAGHVAENPNITIRISKESEGCQISYITSSLGQRNSPRPPPSTGGGTTLPPGSEPGLPPICLKNPLLPMCQPER